MGLTGNSTGIKLLKKNKKEIEKRYDYKIAISGNPNVGKSTIFNNLTGMNQHTGNWPGKTVSSARGICTYKNNEFLSFVFNSKSLLICLKGSIFSFV